MNLFEKFKQLHHNPEPFVLGNIWDVNSAKVFEAAGYKAMGVSSEALSNAWGYNDGENLPFDVLLQVAKRVVEVINIPFTVDMEGGYSNSLAGLLNNINKLNDAGVVGINLEDTFPGDNRRFQPVDEFAAKLSAIAEHISRNNLQIFVNVRTDGFLLGLPNALDETLVRMKSYENTGADGIFVPCITAGEDIRAVVNAAKLPVNVMCMPALPDFRVLQLLGVKRISMGPFLFNKVYGDAAAMARTVIADKNFTSIL